MQEESLIIFPTDTVYGISVYMKDLRNFNNNIKKIYKIKNRSLDKKILLLVNNISVLEDFVDKSNLDENIKKVINKLMPGALTIVFRSSKEVKKYTGYSTIGIRIPNSKTSKILLEKTNFLFTSSANRSFENATSNFLEINNSIIKDCDYIYINDSEGSNISSTIIDYSNSKIELLRQGNIKLERIINEYENTK